MIERIRRAAEWLGDLADKAKAIVGAVSVFAGVVVAATAKEQLGLEDAQSILTAAISLAAVVYYVIWRVPNEGQLNLRELSPAQLRALDEVMTHDEE
jgi:hypothetical protein